MPIYANAAHLPRELRGEYATGESCHHGRALAGEGCPACGAEAGEPVSPESVVEIEPLTASEVSEVVAGFVHAATWTDLDRPCKTCGGAAEVSPASLTDDQWGDVDADVRADLIARSITQTCSDCENGYGETGSDPYEYGPDDLSPDTHARVTEVITDLFASAANLGDLRAYCAIVGDGYDYANGRAYGSLESLGGDLYYTGNGHSAGFGDRELGAYSECDANVRHHGGIERLRAVNAERAIVTGVMRRLAREARLSCGVNAVMMCGGEDETIVLEGI